MTGCVARSDLAAWWLDELALDAADLLELHLLGCAGCAAAAARLVALIDGIVAISDKDGVSPVLTEPQLAALAARVRVEIIVASTGDVVHAAVAPATDFMVLRLGAPLGAVGQLDVEFAGPDGRVYHVVEDAPHRDHEVIIACHRHVMGSTPEVHLRLIDGADPDRRSLGAVVLHNSFG